MRKLYGSKSVLIFMNESVLIRLSINRTSNIRIYWGLLHDVGKCTLASSLANIVIFLTEEIAKIECQ
jgi:hypothetical protein